MTRAIASLAVLFAAVFGAACSDGSVGELDGAHGFGGSGGSGGTGGGTGFTSGGSGGDAGATATAAKAETAFRALLPDLTQACGGACHVNGTGNAPAYLATPDAYKTIKAYKGIVVKDVATSVILTKGRHEGPDLVDPLRTSVQSWLQLEATALSDVVLPMTDPFTVSVGANSVDISKGGTGVNGAKLTFTAQMSGTILTMSNMQIVAPAAAGVHIVFPIFDLVTTQGATNRDMSFSNADQTIAAGQTGTLNPGVLILTGFDATDKMKIEFTKLEAGFVAADAGTAGNGCKSVTSFVTNAVPVIQSNGCLSCHNTGGSGNASLDLSGLAKTPADNATACGQALAKADPANAAQSDLILAPTGQVAAHPFKNASANYATMIEAWLQNEK